MPLRPRYIKRPSLTRIFHDDHGYATHISSRLSAGICWRRQGYTRGTPYIHGNVHGDVELVRHDQGGKIRINVQRNDGREREGPLIGQPAYWANYKNVDKFKRLISLRGIIMPLVATGVCVGSDKVSLIYYVHPEHSWLAHVHRDAFTFTGILRFHSIYPWEKKNHWRTASVKL